MQAGGVHGGDAKGESKIMIELIPRIRILCGIIPHNIPIRGVMRNDSSYTVVMLLS
jgi:hypothetical protein